MIKLVKKNLVITLPIKKLKELLKENESNEPIQIEQPVESVEQTTGDITGGECCAEPIPEVIPEDRVVSTSETEGDNPVSE